MYFDIKNSFISDSKIHTITHVLVNASKILTKSESNDIPEMPSDKRTKAYKEWMKQYGDQTLNDKKNLHLTRQAERALKTTFLEAKLFQSDLINTAHLLLCILRNENDPTTKLLTRLNVDYDIVKEQFKLMLANDSDSFEELPSSSFPEEKDNEDNDQVEDEEELEIFAEKIDFGVNHIKPVSEMHKKMVDQISREVDILAEIAELQMKLVKKIGSKKGDLDSLSDVLSDPNNSFQVSKDTVVRSIKDEIYKKKEHSRMKNNPGENDIHVILNQETKESMTIKDFKAELKAKCALKETDDPLVIFD